MVRNVGESALRGAALALGALVERSKVLGIILRARIVLFCAADAVFELTGNVSCPTMWPPPVRRCLEERH